uniref:F-box domain-containing protein n=1 Tax=Aegilops tauschii TaxID=37682 RepID=N1R3Z3_AEGTA
MYAVSIVVLGCIFMMWNLWNAGNAVNNDVAPIERWSKLPDGFLKINIDASFQKDNETASTVLTLALLSNELDIARNRVLFREWRMSWLPKDHGAHMSLGGSMNWHDAANDIVSSLVASDLAASTSRRINGAQVSKPYPPGPLIGRPPQNDRRRRCRVDLRRLLMGLCVGKSTYGDTCPSSPCWRDLPPEVAGLVLSRLASHNDRLSFGAVCRDWRHALRHQRSLLRPALPCINLGNGTYRSLADNKKVRRCFPTPKGCRAGACFGNLVLYRHKSSGRFFLRDPFFGGDTGAAIEISTNYYSRSTVNGGGGDFGTMSMKASVRIKMLVCSSSSPLIAAILPNISLSAPQIRGAWSPIPCHDHYGSGYKDIAFHHGKAFALTSSEELFCHESFVANRENHQQMHQPLINHVIKKQRDMYASYYLVVSSDDQKLLMVRWRRSSTDVFVLNLCVFEADFDKGHWLEVRDLGEQVLFVGRNCSRAFAAGRASSEHHDQIFQGGNRVFILGTEWKRAWPLIEAASCDPHNLSYCVYDMISGETSLV